MPAAGVVVEGREWYVCARLAKRLADSDMMSDPAREWGHHVERMLETSMRIGRLGDFGAAARQDLAVLMLARVPIDVDERLRAVGLLSRAIGLGGASTAWLSLSTALDDPVLQGRSWGSLWALLQAPWAAWVPSTVRASGSSI